MSYFFLKSIKIIEKYINNHDIEFKIKNIIIIIYSKSMKSINYIQNDIINYHIWNNIEFIINHFIKFYSKNIQINFIIKYISIKFNNDFSNKNIMILREKYINELDKYNQRINLSNSRFLFYINNKFL